MSKKGDVEYCKICGEAFVARSHNHKRCDACANPKSISGIRSDFSPTQLSTFYEDEGARRLARSVSKEQWQARIENQWSQ